jgi:hypothetical protein
MGTKESYLVAIAPAVLAVQKIANDRLTDRGLVLPDRYTDPTEVMQFLTKAGMKFLW